MLANQPFFLRMESGIEGRGVVTKPHTSVQMHAEFHLAGAGPGGRGSVALTERFFKDAVGFLFVANFSSPTSTIKSPAPRSTASSIMAVRMCRLPAAL